MAVLHIRILQRGQERDLPSSAAWRLAGSALVEKDHVNDGVASKERLGVCPT